MLKILLFFFVILILLMIFTQIIIPIFVEDLDFFWLFKKKYYSEKKNTDYKELKDLDDNAKAATEHYKSVVTDLKETEDRLNQIKKQTKI